MADQKVDQFPREELIKSLSSMVEESKGNESALIEKLGIPDSLPKDQYDKLREQLKTIASGNRQDIQKFVDEIERASKESTSQDLLKSTPAGGVTAFHTYWWGSRLYVSHRVLEKSTDIGELAVAIGALCGPPGEAFAIAMAITIAALKLIDQGNGIIITQLLYVVGPPVPTPQ